MFDLFAHEVMVPVLLMQGGTQGVVTLTGMLDGIKHAVTGPFVIGSILVSVACVLYKIEGPLLLPWLQPGALVLKEKDVPV